ncbi:MAG TPA: hypothetical protein VFS21_30240 [Roseiflexaceae bacterium]|nr:hypothetical protein [Roseiflexaceae bacterium]
MTKPALKVEIAFTSNPLATTPTWVDVTADVRERVSIRRGRQTERDRIEAGTATLTLDNRTRKYDSTNTGSPYNGYILPMRPIRIRATWGGITYGLFRGYVAAWSPVEPGGQDAVVNLRCVDAFTYFSQAPLTLNRSQELGNVRIGAILDALGWPAADRAISTAKSTLQSIVDGDASALQHLQNVADSENGLLFIDAQGRVAFQDRHYRLRTSSPAVTIGNNPGTGELPFHDVEIINDDSNIWNEIKVSYTNGTTITVSDATSQLRFFRRTLPISRPHIITAEEARDHANWQLLQRAYPDIRFNQLVLNGHLSDAAWPHLLGREISDRIAMVHRPPGGGPSIQRDLHVEAIQLAIPIKSGAWTATWQLSPANTLSLLVADDLVRGRADQNRAAY